MAFASKAESRTGGGMSILVGKDTRAIVQGITGQAGAFHTEKMLEYGTQVVGGVTPGKRGAEVHGVPVFNRTSLQRKSQNAPNPLSESCEKVIPIRLSCWWKIAAMPIPFWSPPNGKEISVAAKRIGKPITD